MACPRAPGAMRVRGALLLVLAILAAGCAGDPVPPTAATGASGPTPATGGPATSSPLPSSQSPTTPGAGGCVEMRLTAEPARVRPGEEVVFHGTFRNCGDAPIRYEHTCLRPPWHPRAEVNGTTYHALTNGSAMEEWACPAILVKASLAPGETLAETWRWNTTLRACHDCPQSDPAPGVYRFTSVLSRDAVMVPRGGASWNASVDVEVLPR